MKYFSLIFALIMSFNTVGYFIKYIQNSNDGTTAMLIISIMISVFLWTGVSEDFK